MASEHITVVAILTPKPEHKEDVINGLKELVEAVQKEESGALQYELVVINDSEDVVVVEKYANEEALQAHNATQHLAKAFKTAGEGQWLAKAPVISKGKVVAGFYTR